MISTSALRNPSSVSEWFTLLLAAYTASGRFLRCIKKAVQRDGPNACGWSASVAAGKRPRDHVGDNSASRGLPLLGQLVPERRSFGRKRPPMASCR